MPLPGMQSKDPPAELTLQQASDILHLAVEKKNLCTYYDDYEVGWTLPFLAFFLFFFVAFSIFLFFFVDFFAFSIF